MMPTRVEAQVDTHVVALRTVVCIDVKEDQIARLQPAKVRHLGAGVDRHHTRGWSSFW